MRSCSDAYHLGDRCTKRGCTKGICDLCHVFLGQRTPETLRHILLECPFTVPVLTYVWRTIFSQLADPTIRTHSAHLTARAFIERYERRLLFGVALDAREHGVQVGNRHVRLCVRFAVKALQHGAEVGHLGVENA